VTYETKPSCFIATSVVATKVDPNIWRKTKECTDVTRPASRDECQPVVALRPLLAAAQRKGELEAKLPALKADLDRQHLTNAATGSEATVSLAWAWIMGLGVVMIATFGPAIFAKVETVINDEVGQSDFAPIATRSTGVVRDLFRPDDQKPGDGPSKRDPDSPKRPSDGLSKAQALDDLMQRLADGQTIPSQQRLADDWNRPKQTVHEWMKGWRRIGIIPPATPAGRCKATAPA
jgi:hypothetical protein